MRITPKTLFSKSRSFQLTQLLADSLSGQAKVMMFMHVAPEGSFIQESVSTLHFGSKVASVTLGQVRGSTKG